MFHILSGSTPAATKAAVVSEPHHDGRVLDGDGSHKFKSTGGSPTASSSYLDNDHRTPNKKRSRRRRKGKSRSKVEPLSSYKKGSSPTSSSNSKKQHDAPMTKRDIYFALDCEFVGIGPDGMTSAVGRVTIVNWENQIVLDTYVRVPAPVTDYRTHVSGITPEHLQPQPGHSLMTFSEVREKVQSILRGKILIGHALENDLKALGLYHPWTDTRDTATYSFYMREFRDPITQQVSLAPRKLRDLAWEKLGRQIQMPGVPHSPVEDAIAALDLYKEVRGQWEDHLIHVAQEKDKEQQRQLMERRRQQEEEQQQRQQQQQMQMRRFQWLAGSAPAQAMGYPVHPQQQQQHQPMVHPAVQSPSYRYPSALSPTMMVVHTPPSPAAAAYLQPPPAMSPSQPQPMRSSSSSSSWFGFSRRPKPQQPSRIPTTASQDSVATMTTVQSSFSQDLSSSRCAWHVRDEAAEESARAGRMATEASQETILEETVSAPALAETMDSASHSGEYAESTMSCTESTAEASATENSLPTDYEPPRYFTNPDPEPMNSSSWFRLGWGSSRKDKDSSTKGGDSDVEMDDQSEKARRSSHGETSSSYSLFSGRLFPRRNSESCMTNMCEKEVDEHSRSLH